MEKGEGGGGGRGECKSVKLQRNNQCTEQSPSNHHLIGLVVKASAPSAEDPRFESRL